MYKLDDVVVKLMLRNLNDGFNNVFIIALDLLKEISPILRETKSRKRREYHAMNLSTITYKQGVETRASRGPILGKTKGPKAEYTTMNLSTMTSYK